MKFHPKAKIEAVASSDSDRHAIAEAFLDIRDGKGTLVATNGKALAMVPVELAENDVSGYVSSEAMTAARKLSAFDGATLDLSDSAYAKVNSGAKVLRCGDAKADDKFPNWRQVVPELPEKPDFRVGLNAKILWELAQAMGTTQVELVGAGSVIHVRPVAASPYNRKEAPMHVPDARGILMPVVLP